MPRSPARLAAILSVTLIGFGALAASSALLGCAGGSSGAPLRVEPEWRLVPEGTALGQRRQFFLYGRRLDSVRIAAPPSVEVRKGELKPGGRALSLYLTVMPLAKDSLARGEAAGSREIEVETPDTSLAFRLKVVDETVPR
jgi:hypothetical protein